MVFWRFHKLPNTMPPAEESHMLQDIRLWGHIRPEDITEVSEKDHRVRQRLHAVPTEASEAGTPGSLLSQRKPER